MNRATGLNVQPNRNVMATKHLNERKYIKVPVKQKQRKRDLQKFEKSLKQKHFKM